MTANLDYLSEIRRVLMYNLLGINLELRRIVSIDRGREYATCLKFGALAKAQLDEHHVQQER